jgi:LAO/AO transport system kinase
MDIEKRKVFEARILSQMTTAIENRDPQALAMLDTLEPGHARIVGITGPPGAGKSTLVDRIAQELRSQGKTVAILAIDPTSRRTGGALLGDRIRMQQHHADDGIFIRSMATRGEFGGIARATAGVARLMSASGKDYVIIETVGVGQDEVEIAGVAQVTVVVLVPGMGDDVQTIKAGIMEIADIFVINKSDLPGADTVERELQAMLSLSEGPKPSIVRTVAKDGTGVAELLSAIEDRTSVNASPLPNASPVPSRDRKGAGVVVTLRVTDPAAAVDTLRAAGILLEEIPS